MAPMHITSSLLTSLVWLGLGFSFGFFIERGGLANTKKLTAQFFLTDLTVFKVMFTGIITASVLIFGASAMGLLDLGGVWVNPTYLGPGILGGLLLGMGFIIGGYCPGTSLVAVGTGKLDALVFAGGVFAGMVVFGEAVPLFWDAWHHWGALGTVTLYGLAGVDAGWVVLASVLMAVSLFAGAELLERYMGELPVVSSRTRRLELAGAVGLVVLALGVALVGQPSTARKLAWAQPELEATLSSRARHVDPAEVLHLRDDPKVAIRVVDVRDESAWNRFHVEDALHLAPGVDRRDWAARVPADTVLVLAGDEEAEAEQVFAELTVEGVDNLYILEGGLRQWLELYGHGEGHASQALGARHPAARPDPHHLPEREYEPKVELEAAVAAAGGCG